MYCYYKSPVGTIRLEENGKGICRLDFCDGQYRKTKGEQESKLLRQACRQLDEYFAGKRKTFDLPLCPLRKDGSEGTAFQKKVWKALEKIPYGKTESYGAIAKKVGNEKAARAVGMANNKNPIAIIIPCHRVIGADGAKVGFGGGVEKKIALLKLEKDNLR